jgi:glutamyl-tRNA reductase
VLLNLGVTYKKAPLATLDAVTIRDPAQFYRITRTVPGVEGSILLQTCNRVEIFLDSQDGADITGKILWHWALETRFKLNELTRLVEVRKDLDVVAHLVRLSAGLESMLVGESQIRGQMKDSLAEAHSLGAASPLLSGLFEKSASAGTQVRERTGIGKGAVSLGSAAVRLAEETLGSPTIWNVLLMGTGQVGMLALKALKARGVNNILVAGRARQRTESFCRTYGGTPTSLQEARSNLSSLDLVMVATSATGFLLTKETIGPWVKPRLVILDLSNPRNVSPDVQEIPGVVLKTIDDLRGIAEESLARRKSLVDQAEPLVKERVEAIASLLRREKAEPIVSDIYRRADSIRTEELEKAFSKLKLTPEQEEILEGMSQSIVEKLLALPVVKLRKAAEKGDSELLLAGGQIFRSE